MVDVEKSSTGGGGEVVSKSVVFWVVGSLFFLIYRWSDFLKKIVGHPALQVNWSAASSICVLFWRVSELWQESCIKHIKAGLKCSMSSTCDGLTTWNPTSSPKFRSKSQVRLFFIQWSKKGVAQLSRICQFFKRKPWLFALVSENIPLYQWNFSKKKVTLFIIIFGIKCPERFSAIWKKFFPPGAMWTLFCLSEWNI